MMDSMALAGRKNIFGPVLAMDTVALYHLVEQQAGWPFTGHN
jgi:hypothetical protein